MLLFAYTAGLYKRSRYTPASGGGGDDDVDVRHTVCAHPKILIPSITVTGQNSRNEPEKAPWARQAVYVQ